MRDGKRAAISAATFAGFLLVAWLQVVAALLAVLVVLSVLPGSAAIRVAVPLVIATAGLLWWATVRALRLRHPTPAGVPVTRADAAALWQMTDAAAAAAGVRPPDALTVVAGATVALAERVRLTGLRGGRRELFLGLPLLQAWDEPRLRAAVAHELAHGTPRLGRLAPMAYRGRVALSRIVPRIPRRSPAGPLLRAYAAWYRRVDAPFAREQELAADRIAAEFAGGRPAAEVLRDGPALEAMQRLFHAEYVSPGWQTGHVPDDVFGGFLRVLAARADDMARLRALEPEPPGEWDAHPPLADRVAALVALTDEGPEPAERPAAADLVPGLPGLGRALQAVAYPSAGRTVLTWEEFFDAARAAEMEREADASLRAISRVAGSPVTAVADVLDLAADGRLRKIAETVFDDLPADETAGRITDLITLLLALAALHGGRARWRHSWTGTAELVAIDGGHLDLVGPAELAADPATVGEARDRLATLGIDLTAAGPSVAGRPPARVPVIGGVVNVLVDGVRTDVLVVETGLVLMPGLPRSRAAEAKRRLTRLAADGILADGTPATSRPTPNTAATRRPAPDPAATRPAPDTAAGRPAPDPAATRPTPDPAASRPAPDPAATRPTPDPAASRPASGAVASGAVTSGAVAPGSSAAEDSAAGGLGVDGAAASGALPGGSAASGSVTAGGPAPGIAPAGGPAVGGPAVGGPAVGGPAVGGPAVGGPAVGGRAVGGRAVGGPAVGGRAVGGRAVGGPAVGGRAAGGRAGGGVSAGGGPEGSGAGAGHAAAAGYAV
ncbi:M48 family metallopeptidase, partial [Paractinoplanes globisporus]